jgi:hypothetical protein
MAPLLVVLMALASGCASQVGDACQVSTECGLRQVCDTTTVGGYCLRYECTDDPCPDEAACVPFGEVTACMRRCDEDRDCRTRDGHVCRRDIGPIPFCYRPATLPPGAPPPDGPFPDRPLPDAGAETDTGEADVPPSEAAADADDADTDDAEADDADPDNEALPD